MENASSVEVCLSVMPEDSTLTLFGNLATMNGSAQGIHSQGYALTDSMTSICIFVSHNLFPISPENVDFGIINPPFAFFQLGFTQSCSIIPIIDNEDPEPDRTFNVIFIPDSTSLDFPNVEYQPINITVTIQDDDSGGICCILVYLKYLNFFLFLSGELRSSGIFILVPISCHIFILQILMNAQTPV